MPSGKISRKVKNSIDSYIKVLKEDDLPIRHVFLFGSYARGNAKSWSDIDLCIISPRFKDPWEALQYLWSKRVDDVGTTIEPVGFSPKDFAGESPLVTEVKRFGIEIKTP